jgi:hypothetical protein
VGSFLVFVYVGKGEDELTGADFYNVYHDHTYFKYEVVLTRDNEDAGIEGERYILTVSTLWMFCF